MLSEISIDGDILRISSTAKNSRRSLDEPIEKINIIKPPQEPVARVPTLKIKKSQIKFRNMNEGLK